MKVVVLIPTLMATAQRGGKTFMGTFVRIANYRRLTAEPFTRDLGYHAVVGKSAYGLPPITCPWAVIGYLVHD